MKYLIVVDILYADEGDDLENEFFKLIIMVQSYPRPPKYYKFDSQESGEMLLYSAAAAAFLYNRKEVLNTEIVVVDQEEVELTRASSIQIDYSTFLDKLDPDSVCIQPGNADEPVVIYNYLKGSFFTDRGEDFELLQAKLHKRMAGSKGFFKRKYKKY